MIEPDVIDKINALVLDHGLDDTAVGTLRGMWPDIHFTYCSDDDVMAAKPVRESGGFNIYLVDGREHCLRFTSDPLHATGLVLAEVEEDEC
jgi:hypothetical protein